MMLSKDRMTWGFVLNPKCASMAIQEALAPHAIALSSTRRHQLYDPGRGDLRKVVGCVVRNPFERIVSGYEYWKRCGPNPDLSFHDFVFPREHNDHLLCQPHWLSFVRTPQTVWAREATHVIKYENLLDGWQRFCEDAKLPELRLERLNVNPPRKHLSEYYDQFTRRAIEDRFGPDFVEYDY